MVITSSNGVDSQGRYPLSTHGYNLLYSRLGDGLPALSDSGHVVWLFTSAIDDPPTGNYPNYALGVSDVLSSLTTGDYSLLAYQGQTRVAPTAASMGLSEWVLGSGGETYVEWSPSTALDGATFQLGDADGGVQPLEFVSGAPNNAYWLPMGSHDGHAVTYNGPVTGPEGGATVRYGPTGGIILTGGCSVRLPINEDAPSCMDMALRADGTRLVTWSFQNPSTYAMSNEGKYPLALTGLTVPAVGNSPPGYTGIFVLKEAYSVGQDNQVIRVAKSGDDAVGVEHPWYLSNEMQSAAVSMNTRGSVAYSAKMQADLGGGPSLFSRCVWVWQDFDDCAIWDETVLLVRMGLGIPVVSGQAWVLIDADWMQSAAPLVFNDRDEVIFVGRAQRYESGNPVEPEEFVNGIWVASATGGTQPLVLEGQNAPPVATYTINPPPPPPLKFQAFDKVVSNSQGDIAFSATVKRANDVTTYRGVWLFSRDDCTLRRVVLAGVCQPNEEQLPATVIDLPEGKSGRIIDVDFQGGSGGSDGRMMALNNNGDMTLYYHICVVEDGVARHGNPLASSAPLWAIAVLDTDPECTCDGDVNCDQALNGFDVQAMEAAVGGDMTDFCQADPDFNRDFSLSGADVEAVEIVVGGGPCP